MSILSLDNNIRSITIEICFPAKRVYRQLNEIPLMMKYFVDYAIITSLAEVTL